MATVQHTQVVVPAPPGPFDPAIPQDAILRERVEQLIDFIMKNCLWQFHSRRWDRVRQNENILGMTARILAGEQIDLSDPFDRCYHVDAYHLAESYRRRCAWMNELHDDEIREVIAATKARLDVLTITGSLNAELTDKHY
ncbi:MAG: nitrogenase delta subunit [Actinomycetota bacterium]|nr:nitrogenase delta subunit [Actinomycetota bacterium]